MSALPLRSFRAQAPLARCQPMLTASRRITILPTIAEVRALRHSLAKQGRTVGFVPTMGALHAGHLELAKAAKKACDTVVASVFVNPTQFGPNEDFSKYPRDLEGDVRKLSTVGVDYVFAPDRAEMYRDNPPLVFVTIEGVEQLSAEGRVRPGHFRGVATVVSKLFNIVQPTQAFFGQKDGMQCVVIKRLVSELNFPTEVVVCPTIREADGLAMSSRNVYLKPDERAAAPVVYRSLQAAEAAFRSGERDAAHLRSAVQAVLDTAAPLVVTQYVSVASADSGHEISGKATGPVMVSIAVKLPSTRLIDNIILQ